MSRKPALLPLITEMLAGVGWLGDCAQATRELLASVAIVRRYDRQQAVFLRGEPIGHLWLVVEGAIELSVTGADGKRFVAAQVPPGEAVGFIPMLDQRGAIHDAWARVPTTLLCIPCATFLQAMQVDLVLLRAVLRLILERGRRLNEWRAEVTIRPLAARLARLLVGLAGAYGETREADQDSASIKVTHDDLAAMVGVTRQAIHPEIKLLAQRGLIELAYGRIVLKDVPALKLMAV